MIIIIIIIIIKMKIILKYPKSPLILLCLNLSYYCWIIQIQIPYQHSAQMRHREL